MNNTVTKPWGYYVDLDQGDGWKTKRLEIEAGQRLSLQMHGYRDEFWTVVSGCVLVTQNDKTFWLREGETVRIKVRDWHRAKAGDDGCTIIEVQMGVCDENDIQRREDDYGRAER